MLTRSLPLPGIRTTVLREKRVIYRCSSSSSLRAARRSRFQFPEMEINDEQFNDVYCTEVQAVAWEADTTGKQWEVRLQSQDEGIVCSKSKVALYHLLTSL